MQPFITVTGPAAPLPQANIDTDTIIRIERLIDEEARKNPGPYAFEALRYRSDGSEDPDFVLNRPQFRSAPILLAGPNFGCGSSREGAVWALQGTGIRCIVAESFGDIFFSNCFQNGVLPIRLGSDQLRALSAMAGDGAAFTADLNACLLIAPDGSRYPFEVDPLRRQSLLEGLDEIGLTLKYADEIDAWQERDRAAQSWRWPEHSPS